MSTTSNNDDVKIQKVFRSKMNDSKAIRTSGKIQNMNKNSVDLCDATLESLVHYKHKMFNIIRRICSNEGDYDLLSNRN